MHCAISCVVISVHGELDERIDSAESNPSISSKFWNVLVKSRKARGKFVWVLLLLLVYFTIASTRNTSRLSEDSISFKKEIVGLIWEDQDSTWRRITPWWSRSEVITATFWLISDTHILDFAYSSCLSNIMYCNRESKDWTTLLPFQMIASDRVETLISCTVGVFLLLSDKQTYCLHLLIQHLKFSRIFYF